MTYGSTDFLDKRTTLIERLPRMQIADSGDAGEDAFGQWWRSFLRGAGLPPTGPNSGLRVVDLFCGAGGLALGAELAARCYGVHVDVRAAADADPGALDVYRVNNAPFLSRNESVTSLVDYRIRKRSGKASFAYPPEIIDPELAQETGPDIVLAGPPCQGHSNLNNHTRRNDPRDDLFVTTVAAALALGTKVVVIENVPTVTRSHSEVVEAARCLFNEHGYQLDEAVLSLDRMGGAQTRSRYFMIATRGDCIGLSVAPSLAEFARRNARPSRSTNWAIADLEDVDGNGLFDTAPRVDRVNQDRIDWLFDNDEFDLPNARRPACHRNGTKYTAVYGRMDGDRPAPTLTTGFGSPGQGRFIHPNRRRMITPHEAARLQGFPDSYSFELSNGNVTRQGLNKWIGDAVPSPLAMYVVVAALKSLFGHEPRFPWVDE